MTYATSGRCPVVIALKGVARPVAAVLVVLVLAAGLLVANAADVSSAASSPSATAAEVAQAQRAKRKVCTKAHRLQRKAPDTRRAKRAAQACTAARQRVRQARREHAVAVALTEQAVQPAAPPPAGAPAPGRRPGPVQEYVALGDSWTADVVILDRNGLPDTTHAPIDCAQSHTNYPKLVQRALAAATFRDASCGAATTDDFANPQTGLPLGGTNPPQFARLTPTTDLVTVGIGGNDAGIASAGLDCLNLLPVDNPISQTGPGLPLGGCRAKYVRDGVDQLSVRIQQSEAKLVAAFKAIRDLAPHARILAVDYMAVVPAHACYPRVPATETDISYIHDKFVELNAMVRRAAARGGAEFVDTYAATLGHDLCQGPFERYAEVFGLSLNGLAVGVPAHPNSAGARAQADAVLGHLATHPG